MKNTIPPLHICLFVFTLLTFLESIGHAITVKPNGGIDNSTCCQSSVRPCKSLAYAFACISRKTAGSPSVISIEGAASLIGRTELIIPKNYNVTVESQTAVPAVISCDSNNSMLFVRSNGERASVAFRNVLVRNCGAMVPSAVLIEGPLNAQFNNCTFMNNTCSGLNIRDANLTVIKSQFRDNIANRSANSESDFIFGNISLGGGLGIIFNKGIGNKVNILSSNFVRGVRFANFDPSDPNNRTSKTKMLSNYYGSGSGLSIVNTFHSQDNSVIIKNCNFEENHGTYGGGLFLTFDHDSTGNSILVENCTVARNFVTLTGGGLLISSWDRAHNNMVILKECNIFLNNAMGGGAMKVIYNNIDPSNMNREGLMRFQMHNCNIFNNIAMSGSALRLLSIIPSRRVPLLLPKLYNCTISGHSPVRGSKEYPGAILSTKVGIEFHGINYLINNTQGSAIHMSSGTIHVKGHLVFDHNRGRLGGAAYLADHSIIRLYPGSYLRFSSNHASFRGGGLYVEVTALQEVTYPYNPGCFIQYSEAHRPPSEWKTKVEFTNNSASLKGAALFLNSLVGCRWGEDDASRQLNQTLRWADKITYADNFILLENNGVKIEGPKVDIATDTYDYIVGNPHKPLKVAPGEKFTFNISAIDQLGNKVYSLPVVKQIFERSATQEISVGEQYLVLHLGQKTYPQLSLTLPGIEMYKEIVEANATEFIRISDTQSSFLVEKKLRLETQRCNPGFFFDGNTCVCNSSIPGLERCSKGRYLYLKEGYWGGLVNDRFVTHICPRGYCTCLRKQGAIGCFYDFKKPNDLCMPGRVGVLCGKCKTGLAVSLQPERCTVCHKITGVVFGVFVVMTILVVLLIIYLNPNIAPDLRGILFYFQVMPFVVEPNSTVGYAVTFISGISDFGRPMDHPLIPTCIMPGLGNLKANMLNYTTPVVVLIILVLIYCFRAKFTVKRDKPFQCFFVLLVLVYKYCVETSFSLLHCVDVGGRSHNEHSSDSYPANGTQDTEMHYCSPCSEKLNKACKSCSQRANSCLSKYLKTERGWWWSVEFIRRAILVALYVFVQDWKLKQTCIAVSCACIFALHCVAWPYDKENQWANKIEAVYLFALTILAYIQSIESSNIKDGISIGILLLTYGFGIIFFIFKAVIFVQKFCKKPQKEAQEKNMTDRCHNEGETEGQLLSVKEADCCDDPRCITMLGRNVAPRSNEH